jgi:thioester reductase-like protein
LQISTASVGGASINGNPPSDTRLTEKMLYFGQDVSNKYVHSKFIAERLVLEAVAKGEFAEALRGDKAEYLSPLIAYNSSLVM